MQKGWESKSRKAIDRLHASKASCEAKNIKLCDAIHNGPHISELEPAFARIYIPEKLALLDVLRGGDSQLFSVARKLVTLRLEA